MNDINEMPPKCQYCPYWEVCEYPWVCPDREQLATNLQQTCNQLATDTINRQAAIDAVSDCGICIQRIVDLPSAQPERIKGRWINDGLYSDNFPHHAWHCSECEESVLEIDEPWFKFCPNCGARMENSDERFNQQASGN